MELKYSREEEEGFGGPRWRRRREQTRNIHESSKEGRKEQEGRKPSINYRRKGGERRQRQTNPQNEVERCFQI